MGSTSTNTPCFRISFWCKLLLLTNLKVITVGDTETATGGLSSDEVASSQDYCRRHKLGMSCCQDPCSKTGDRSSPKACAYCTKTGVCQAAENISDVCLRDNTIEVTDRKCPAALPQSRRCIAETADYYINLTTMDSVNVTDKNGNKLVIGICRDVSIRKGTALYECCGTCVAPVFLCNSSDIESTCWALGNLTGMDVSFISETDPRKGVVLQYGTTDCCLNGQNRVPGITESLYLRIFILSSDNSDKTSLQGGAFYIHNFPSFDGLKDCSAAVNGSIEVKLMSDDFLSRVEYKLSSVASRLTCSTSDKSTVTVKCQLFPVLQVNKTSATDRVCQRLEITIYYDNGQTTRQNMNRLKHPKTSGLCSFEIAIERNVSAIGVTDPDVDSDPIGGLYNVTYMYHPDHSSNTIMIACGCVAAVVIIILILIAIYKKRKTSSNDVNVAGEENDGQMRSDNTDPTEEASCAKPLLHPQKPDFDVKTAAYGTNLMADGKHAEVMAKLGDIEDKLTKDSAEDKKN